MKRRQFLGLVGGAAALPREAWAQQSARIKKVGVILPAGPEDREYQARVSAFTLVLQQRGWVSGTNLSLATRWATTDPSAILNHTRELIDLAPDVILVHGATTLSSMLRITRTVPIVFAIVADPVGAGYVNNLARPGGNATGFMVFEPSISGKWVELLRQLAPNTKQGAILLDSANPTGTAHVAVLEEAARALDIKMTRIDMRNTDMEREISVFAKTANGGLIVTPSGLAQLNRTLIVTLAARYKLPTVFFERSFVTQGGLASYGPDFVDQYRQAATYVDRILKGERPENLPVQAPTKYELVINLKTAMAQGLEVPLILQQRADEVIE